MRLKNSFWALLGRSGVQPTPAVMENIRTAMLDALDRECLEPHVDLDAKISNAQDVETLWYLRSDLLHAIASCRDEGVARTALLRISNLFVGHHPAASAPRPQR